MRFSIGLKDLTGTNAERRVKEVINKGHEATQSAYKLKSHTLRFNTNKGRYTEE